MHQELAVLDPDDQDIILDWAEEKWPDVSQRDVRRKVREMKAAGIDSAIDPWPVIEATMWARWGLGRALKGKVRLPGE